MKLENFSLEIPEGREADGGYVHTQHGKQYTLNITNHQNKRCAAEITIDGKHVGTFRINSYGSLKLERPTGDTGRFTFYEDGSKEFKQAHLEKVAKSDRGLITVLFKPEKTPVIQEVEQIPWVQPFVPKEPWPRPIPRYPYEPPLKRSGGPCGQSMSFNAGGQHTNSMRQMSVKSGGTGLSGSSNQKFHTVADLDYAEDEFVTINLRLVGEENSPRELKATKSRSTPVPNPV